MNLVIVYVQLLCKLTAWTYQIILNYITSPLDLVNFTEHCTTQSKDMPVAS